MSHLTRLLRTDATLGSSELVEAVLFFMYSVCLVPEHRSAVLAGGAVAAILKAYNRHSGDPGVEATFRDIIEELADAESIGNAVIMVRKAPAQLGDKYGTEREATADGVADALALLAAVAVAPRHAAHMGRADVVAHLLALGASLVKPGVPDVPRHDDLLAGVWHTLAQLCKVAESADAIHGASFNEGPAPSELCAAVFAATVVDQINTAVKRRADLPLHVGASVSNAHTIMPTCACLHVTTPLTPDTRHWDAGWAVAGGPAPLSGPQARQRRSAASGDSQHNAGQVWGCGNCSVRAACPPQPSRRDKCLHGATCSAV